MAAKAQERPVKATVIWRPGSECQFRGDHVEAASEDVEAIMASSFEVVRLEMAEAGCTAEEIEDVCGSSYDLCAILRGHCSYIY